MEKRYSPPFTIGSKTLRLVAEICELTGNLASSGNMAELLKLRRINQLRTVQGSLAIEGNTLSLEQITAIIAGKRVVAPAHEIIEARNAVAVYEKIDEFDFRSLNDLLAAHSMLMKGILDSSGKFRKSGAGVMAGTNVIHVAPPAKQISLLMNNLFGWLSTADEHPLILSTVFHYEFEFIHPFVDGNGRMGRLWQTLILAKWQPVMTLLPVESLIHANQQEYYDAIALSTKLSNSNPFIDFMLKIILQAIQERVTPEVAPHVTPEVKKMLSLLQKPLSRREIMHRMKLSDEKHFRQFYLHSAIKAGLIEMTVPDHPRSRLQKYRLTPAGKKSAVDFFKSGNTFE